MRALGAVAHLVLVRRGSRVMKRTLIFASIYSACLRHPLMPMESILFRILLVSLAEGTPSITSLL